MIPMKTMKTMEHTSKMGNTTATITPSNCDLKMNASKLNRSAAVDCDSNGSLPLKNRRKSHLYQSNRSPNTSNMVGNGGDGENDCTSSPRSQSKKPLHLQIIEDGTYSSSGNENETAYSTGSSVLTARPSPSSNHIRKDGVKSAVPVTSERDDIIQREKSSLNDGIIIQSSSSSSFPPINRSAKSSSFSAFVPLGDELKREYGSNAIFDGGGGRGGLSDCKTDQSGGENNSNSNSVKHLSREKNSDLHCKTFDLSEHKKKNIPDRENQSESSTPDLASTLPCVNDSIDDSMSKSVIIHKPVSTNNSAGAIRSVSLSCSEINSEVDDEISSKSFQSTTISTKTKLPQASNEPLTGNVASALDQVLAELEENGMKRKRQKPCILQQSLVGDSGSSGTSTPNEDVLDAKKDSDISCDDKANSLQVQPSMLLPEDSLNAIAQMTVSQGSKKEKKNVVTFKDDKEGRNDSVLPNSDSGKINSNETPKRSRKPLSEAIKMDIVPPIIPSPVNDNFTTEQVDITPPKATKKAPLISGTASAQLKLLAAKSSGDSNHKSQPQTPLVDDAKTKADNRENVNGWEKGMSMLADIISHATPMKMKARSQSQSSTDGENTALEIAPVGQSLRLYTSIAAQAGISSYTPSKIATESAVSHQISNIQQVEKQGNDCQQSCVPIQEPVLEAQHLIREIGKIRRYDASIGAFSEWENLPFQTYGDSEPRRWCELNIDESIEIPLRRGGRLRVFPNFLGETRRSSVKFAMDDCRLYRQYNVIEGNRTMLEPRLQVLLSSQSSQDQSDSGAVSGYVYKGVSMKAKPLSEEPQVEKLHNDLAELYRLPNKQWNIGANLLYYRDGDDHTTWHSDDTQGEALILCIVVDSQSHARPILVKPKTDAGFRDGDEEIIIFVGQGDAYEMDGQMQLNYEHCLPMKQDDVNAKRTAIIFRHGSTVPVSLDTGIPLINEGTEEVNPIHTTDSGNNATSSHFGHIGGEIREGKKLYSRSTLKRLAAHRHDKKTISGSIRDGCESILVESQNRNLREDDGLCWLQISCDKASGGGALSQSYHKKTCIRVFRSSELQNKYAPVLYEGEDDILYRYDGLYTVRAMWDSEGSETEQHPSSDEMHTFFLMRQPKRPANGSAADRKNYNKISLQELWNEIQKRKGVRKPKEFAVPEPIMDVGRIGGSRRRIASSRRVLKSEEKNIKHPVKRKNVNVVPLQNYSTFLGNGFHHRAIYSSDSDSCEESDVEVESTKSGEVEAAPVATLHDNGRPRRKSAAVARTYLKEVMHNRYGDMEANTPQKSNVVQSKKRSIWSADGKSENERKNSKKGTHKRQRRDGTQHSSSDDSDADIIESGEKLLLSDTQDQPDDTEGGDNDLKMQSDDGAGEDVDETNSETKDASNKSNGNEESPSKGDEDELDVPEKGEGLDPNIKQEELEENEHVAPTPSEESDTIVKPVEPGTILVGSRVNVEYRNTLFKATVRRTRVKAGIHEYSIHYDGNKKSNVHWIPFSMIHDVLDEEPIDVSPEVKPKRGRKKKAARAKPIIQEVVKEEFEEIEPEEVFKFAINTEVYVMYKTVLYLSIVKNARKNRKGNPEYLVHYEGFKKTADRWIKESALFEVNDETTRRFNEQRGFDDADETSPGGMKKTVKKLVMEEGLEDAANVHVATRSSIENSPQGHDNDENQVVTEQLDMGDLDSGVEFLPGSCVFVVRTNALYLAKMVKRRKKGRGKEYLVQFDGMSSKFNEWTSLSNIYELNPKTRKIYERTASLRKLPKEEEDNEESESEDETETPKKEVLKLASKPASAAAKPRGSITPKSSARISKRGSAKGRAKKPKTSQLYDMHDIEPGVEFLPGSTLFVQWKNGLYLGKMLKKRGKGEYMEYLIHYDGYKSSQDEWVSVSMVFEINPQTKRAFNKQKKT